jgi:hypothetical protein
MASRYTASHNPDGSGEFVFVAGSTDAGLVSGTAGVGGADPPPRCQPWPARTPGP